MFQLKRYAVAWGIVAVAAGVALCFLPGRKTA